MIRKGMVGLVLGVFMVFISCPLAWAQKAILSLDTTQYGAELETVVNLSSGGEVATAQLDIVYDQNSLTLAGDIVPTEAVSSAGFKLMAKEVSPGRIRVVIIPPITSPLPVLPNGTLAKVSFFLLSDEPSVLVLSNVVLSDATGKNVATDR